MGAGWVPPMQQFLVMAGCFWRGEGVNLGYKFDFEFTQVAFELEFQFAYVFWAVF